MQKRWRIAALAAALGTLPAGAAVPRADYYVPVHMSATNAGAEPLECQAVAGHWYSFDLGIGATAARLDFDLSVDPKTGTVVMYNSAKDPVPIETVFCGIKGKAWDTRFVFPLRTIAEQAAIGKASDFQCEAKGDTVACR